jgi:hypothetical protein
MATPRVIAGTGNMRRGGGFIEGMGLGFVKIVHLSMDR